MTPPLLPNTDFSNVTLWTPDLAYLAFNQVRDGQTQYLGHHSLITDSELDNTSSGILYRVNAITSPFLVSQVGTSGSVITWQAGQFRQTNSLVSTIASGQLNLPADSTNYVYINSSGVVTYSSASTDTAAFAGVPVLRHLLAKVVVVSTNISSITDLRNIAIRGASPPTSVIRTFGGQATTDITVTSGQTLTGTIYCRNFTVPSGISCTVKYYCKIICSGTFTNNGTINTTRYPYGAPTFFAQLTKSSGVTGQFPGIGLGTRGSSYDPSIQASSSGGSQGSAVFPNEPVLATGYAALGAGGDAGATLIVEAFGQITQNGTISADGGNASAVSNVFIDATGASVTAKCLASGSGGGGGGLVSLTSLTGITCTSTSVTSVKGGAGSDALINTTASNAYYALGGFGGGGGYIVLNTPGTLTTTGATFTLTGGNAGNVASVSSGIVVNGSIPSYKILNSAYGIGGGTGGGFGGAGGTYTSQSTDATYTYFTLSPGSPGQLLTSSSLPLS